MLVAHAHRELGGARLLATLVFAGGFWATVSERTGLILDSRYVPAQRGDPDRGVCLYLLLQGRFVMRRPMRDGGPPLVGPVALAFAQEHLVGARGVRPIQFRLDGEPLVVCELHFDADDVGFTTGSEPEVVTVGDAVWVAASRFVAAASTSDRPAIAVALRALIETLSVTGHVAPRMVDAADRALPFEALWRAVRPLAERFALSSTIDELAMLANLSNRHIARHLRSFFEAFPIVGGGFRPTLVHMRLKLAVQFLSAPDARVGDVAKLVGYGSVEAMSRAFRDAGIPSPSAIRAALLAGGSDVDCAVEV